MIRLGLRLTLGGGREALARLVVTAAAVALGVALLLVTLAGITAVNRQNSRDAWLDSGSAEGPPPRSVDSAAGATTASGNGLWWLLKADEFEGRAIGRLDIAPIGTRPPIPPGIAKLPLPGQYYVSPAMGRLLATTPKDELGDRFPGHLVGTIAATALPSPNFLLVVSGRTPAQLAANPEAQTVAQIDTNSPSSCDACGPVGFDASALDLILAVGALSLLLPVLVLIGTATRLAAARREQRFAALRLVGATPAQVSLVAAVEATVASAIGVLGAFLLFFALRTSIAGIPFTGSPFYPSDLSLSLVDVLLVALGVPLASALAARLALRRVTLSPLGVSRQVTPDPPRAIRLIPLSVGVIELVVFLVIGPPATSGGQVLAYLPGFLLIMIGLVVAGPWLVMTGAGFMARRTRRPASLIAGRRLADNPRAGFRAVSGLVLALFVTSASVGVITTVAAAQGAPNPANAATEALVDQFPFGPPGPPGPPGQDRAAAPATSLSQQLDLVRAQRGVTAVVATRLTAVSLPTGKLVAGRALVQAPQVTSALVTCDELVRIPSLGRCRPGATVAAVPDNLMPASNPSSSIRVWPTAHVAPAALVSLSVGSVFVGTDGSAGSIERARTALEIAFPAGDPPTTIGEVSAKVHRTVSELKQLSNVVILVSLAIAGCSLAVSVAAGLIDRKRPFSLLRLSGVPLSMLRRIVGLESVVPLLATALLSAVMGFVAAQLFLRSQLGYNLKAPGGVYYLMVGAGLAASLGVIVATLPLLSRITGPDTARNE